MSDPEIELPEKIKLAERAEKLFELAISGFWFGMGLAVICFFADNQGVTFAAVIIITVSVILGDVAKYYKRKVMGP